MNRATRSSRRLTSRRLPCPPRPPISRTGWVAFLLVTAFAVTTLPGPAQAGPFELVPVGIEDPVAFATGVVELVRGPIDPSQPELGLATAGDPAFVLGPATGMSADIVSLGNGGSITLSFDSGIRDGDGADFAVFENGFAFQGDVFGELAFVEVSSNGTDFARFMSISLNPGPIADFDPVDPTQVQNLAGQFVAGQGTPFDLGALASDELVLAGRVDLAAISFVRLIDVVGDGSTLDSQGNPIFDPFPTAFGSSGFDLEAVGVLNAVREVPEVASFALLVLAGLGFVCRHR